MFLPKPYQNEYYFRRRKIMRKGTYVTDITHFLDETGNIPVSLPKPASQLASFLAIIIDETTRTASEVFNDIELTCAAEDCTGSILSRFESETDDIIWNCPDCGSNGVIRNWQNTKWNHLKS